ncbi:uncharacterized protein MAM_07180 [Metarhizium album ARSEF 1941]|uniref:Uncharacterized protein n=1 Tax=Metarhizium album (strain ARSEF 1941) TaxID=1081103 RepID=A0A0B2WLY4_METAS|nr:uncharacterized protein MAM_07180 [Metarhizium album ARSEF 1941]KHN94953.1 hypothetical protein MAM_07180 [Metarhizium album ARSEF 1941]
MAMLKSLIAAILLLSPQVLAGLREAPIPGYDVVDLTWEVEVLPGRVENLTGTVEQVHDAARAINPDWRLPSSPAEPEDLAKRSGMYAWSTAFCGPGTRGWRPCKARRVQEGINHLRSQLGHPRNGPGPRSCGRVSCSWQASIWWCNDAPWATVINSWNDIADSAQLILWKCATGSGAADRYVAGQVFTIRKWNVIVRQDEC